VNNQRLNTIITHKNRIVLSNYYDTVGAFSFLCGSKLGKDFATSHF
jgi:hypothetical protein